MSCIRNAFQRLKAVQDKTNSSNPQSELVLRFVQRSNSADGNPVSAMCAHIANLHKRVKKHRATIAVDHYYAARGIRAVNSTANRRLDGFLEPLGTTFDEGFVIHLNGTESAARRNFTIAHEICHTFFYELVPELKFVQHATDPEEERLCDIGAAELLMPAKSVRRLARKQPVSLEALDSMAHYYQVSRSSMLVRLRALKLWKARLSAWRISEDGSLSRTDYYSGQAGREWSWSDSDVVAKMCNAKEGSSITKGTFIESRDEYDRPKLWPVYVESRRVGNLLTVLLTPRKRKEIQSERCLFPEKLGATVSPFHPPPAASPARDQDTPAAESRTCG